MKKTIIFIFTALVAIMSLEATDIKNIRIYLNPGHGSWGPEDRPMATIPYPNTMETGRPDTCGFYESNTNLWKTLGLGQKLVEYGFSKKNIVHSRVTNGPFPYVAGAANAEVCNRNLSEICEEVEAGNFDLFLSVHSNAAAEGAIANYPLLIFRGHDDGSTSAAGSKDMCKSIWPLLMSNGIDNYTYYSPTNPNIRGDIDFYHASYTDTRNNGKSYTGYLGVLKHSVPGLLSEGYFHTYQPARHRALNRDYCIQEGVRYMRGILDYFGLPGEKIGYIMGTVKDGKNRLNHPLYQYDSSSNDRWYPVNGAMVTLFKDGKQVSSYQVDKNYNGVFVFSNLEPGEYTLKCTADNYQTSTKTLKVTANTTTYPQFLLTPENGYAPPYPTDPTIESSEHVNFAYSLRCTTSDDSITCTFSSTGEAKSASLVLKEQTTGKVVSFQTNEVKMGKNTISIGKDQLPQGVYDWSIQIESNPVSEVRTFFRLANTGTGSGVAINNNTTSRYFGQIYFSDSYASAGLFMLNADLKTVNSTALFKSQFAGDNFSPGRLAINPNTGNVFIADWNDAHSGIYYFSPLNRTRLYTFFNGTRESTGRIVSNTVAIGGSTSGLCFVGKGSDTQLYAFEEDCPTANANQLCRYDMGLVSSWSKAPTARYSAVSKLMLNTNVNLLGDDNGVWLTQTRSSGHNTADVPALVYMKKGGNIVFNSGNALKSLNGCNGGGLAVNADNSIMAITNGDTGIEIYALAWRSGTPSFVHKYTITNSNGSIAQMAFDYAGNLYVSARYGNKAYVLPNTKPVVTTPALGSITIEDASAVKTVRNSEADEYIYINNDHTTLNIVCAAQTSTATLYSAEGVLLHTVDIQNGRGSVDIANLPTGVYYVHTGNKSFSFAHTK